MNKIKLRSGIVLISVCDEHLLVATREARKFVPYIQQINNAAAYYWQLLEEGTEVKVIVDKAMEQFHIPKIKALITVNNFINKLNETGYITIEDVEDDK